MQASCAIILLQQLLCDNSTSTGTLLRGVISGMLCAAFAYKCGGPHRLCTHIIAEAP